MGYAIVFLLDISNLIVLPPLIFLSWQFAHHICSPHFYCRLICSQRQIFFLRLSSVWCTMSRTMWIFLAGSHTLCQFFDLGGLWWFSIGYMKGFTWIIIGDGEGVILYSWGWCGLCVTDSRYDCLVLETVPDVCFSQVVLFFLIV